MAKRNEAWEKLLKADTVYGGRPTDAVLTRRQFNAIWQTAYRRGIHQASVIAHNHGCFSGSARNAAPAITNYWNHGRAKDK